MIRGMDEDMVRLDAFVAVFAVVGTLGMFAGMLFESWEAVIAVEIAIIGPLLVAKDYK